MTNRGFTLIEIVIALVIFATIAVLTSSVLYQSFQTRERMTVQSDRLQQLQLALTLIQRDTVQLVARPVRGNEMHLFPPIIAQPTYVEFTRDGAANPMGIEHRSTLKRTAYLCQKGHLIRRVWTHLDTPNRDDYQDMVMLNDLSQCSFAYMGLHNNVVSIWNQDMPGGKKIDKLPLPKAIQLKITLKGWGDMTLLFIIPKALYA
ncbi:MAG: GspJ family T2SS minor pseudopilin variant LspJ [Legionellaceae bacterium]|nr:GspJ family T2SS minor pseudopilin variant LspJ [Legionellaceae bacterium]